MKFNLEAAKAYVGGILATAGTPIAMFIITLVEKSTGFDLPVSIEGIVITAITFVLGYVGVYATPNQKPS